jgi:hypothetical protein
MTAVLLSKFSGFLSSSSCFAFAAALASAVLEAMDWISEWATAATDEASNDDSNGDSTRPLRIAAVFIIIFASACGVFPPILLNLSEAAMNGILFSCAKVFGGAVILTTGKRVHLDFSLWL